VKKDSTKNLLTTSEAADLLAVTPDAVRKWVQFGRLEALRTPGGHYRIPREVISLIGEMKAHLESMPQSSLPFQFCWEYCGTKNGQLDEDCRTCLVYKSLTLCCFELNREKVTGINATIHCKTDCTQCAYYKKLQDQAEQIKRTAMPEAEHH